MNTTDNTRLDELLRQYRYLSIADLEATCTEHGSIEFNELETIGIGALMVCTKQLPPCVRIVVASINLVNKQGAVS